MKLVKNALKYYQKFDVISTDWSENGLFTTNFRHHQLNSVEMIRRLNVEILLKLVENALKYCRKIDVISTYWSQNGLFTTNF